MQQTFTELKGEIDCNIVIGDFNAQLSTTGRTATQRNPHTLLNDIFGRVYSDKNKNMMS